MALGEVSEVCGLCGRDEEWHEENRPHHPYLGNPGGLNDKPKPVTQVSKGLGGDPALRLALVEAGIITYGQIMVSEERLRNAAREGKAIVISDELGKSGLPIPEGGSGTN